MNKAKRDTALGSVFFCGIALLLWATQELSGISLTPKQNITVDFVDTRGLRTGEPVFVLGTQIGRVVDVAIREEEGKLFVRARFELDIPVQFKRDAVIRVVDSSFLGGKRVEIHPGSMGDNVDSGEVRFRGTAPLGPLNALGDLVSDERVKENLIEGLASFRQFVDKLNSGKGSLARFIESDQLMQDAEGFIASARRSAEELEKKQSLLGRLIYEKELGDKADNILTDVEKITAKLNTTEGTLGLLINDNEIGKKLEKVVDGLAGTKSTLGKLINDDGLGKKLDKIAANLEKTTATLNDKDAGLLSALIHDEKLLIDGRRILKDFGEIMEKVNNGDGVLARLINDRDMGRRLDSVLKQVTRAIEDAREAAPIGTFFQVFGGAF